MRTTFFQKYALICFFSFFLLFVREVFAKGDLSIKAKPLELILGSKTSDYDMSAKEFKLETGQAYRLRIESLGFKEYEFAAPEFFENVWIRKIEVEEVQISAPVIDELEFEGASEIEIFFVPIRPGFYEFEIEGLESKGMVGKIIVK